MLRERHSLCRYLFFYSETLELLLRSGVLTPDQTGLSVVSEAIAGLWSSLPPERRAEAQQHALDQSPVSWESQTEIIASPSSNSSASYVVEEVRSNVANLSLFQKAFVPCAFLFLNSFLSYKWLLRVICFSANSSVCVLPNP